MASSPAVEAIPWLAYSASGCCIPLLLATATYSGIRSSFALSRRSVTLTKLCSADLVGNSFVRYPAYKHATQHFSASYKARSDGCMCRSSCGCGKSTLCICSRGSPDTQQASPQPSVHSALAVGAALQQSSTATRSIPVRGTSQNSVLTLPIFNLLCKGSNEDLS